MIFRVIFMVRKFFELSKLREYKLYYLVFVTSFVLQLVFIAAFNSLLKEPDIIVADTVIYYEVAQNILHTGSALLYSEINVERPPFYPFFLAAVFYIFGNKIIFVQLFQAFLIALSCVVILNLGRIIFNKKVGFLSAMLVAVNPVIVASSFYLLMEAVLIFLLSILAFVLTKAFIKEKTFFFVLSSLLIALITLTKPILILYPFFIAFILILYYKSSKAIKYSALLIFPALLVISAWTIRNYYHTKLFIPVTLGGGIELWNGSYIPGEGYSDHPKTNEQRHKIYTEFMAKNRLSEDYLKNGKGTDYYLYHLAMQDFQREAIVNITTHPFRYLSLVPKKIIYLYVSSYSFLFKIKEPFNTFLFRGDNRSIAWRIPKLLFKSCLLLLSTIIFVFCLIGIIQNLNNRKFLAIFSIILYWSLFFSFLSPISRYGIPVSPLMILTAANSIVNLFKIRKDGVQR